MRWIKAIEKEKDEIWRYNDKRFIQIHVFFNSFRKRLTENNLD